MYNKEGMNPVTGRSRTNEFENVPEKIPFYVNGSPSKNSKHNTKRASMRISGISELSYKTLGGSHSGSVGHVTQVGITKKGHVRAKDPVPNRSGPERCTDHAVLSDAMAAYRSVMQGYKRSCLLHRTVLRHV
jgi:hypothetical protein